MIVERISQLTRKTSQMEIDVTSNQLYEVDRRYDTGRLIQDIVPNLSSEEREFLMTGYTLEEQAIMFANPFEDEEEDGE